MSGPFHGWLYGQGSDGAPYEIINQARLAGYLRSPSLNLPSGLSICEVLNFGGCEAYAYKPPCDGEPGNARGCASTRGGSGQQDED